MSSDEHLIRRSDDPFERLLLDAANDDAPPEGAIDRAAIGLGKRAALMAAAIGSAAPLVSDASAGSAASATSVAPPAKLAGVAAWKWIFVGSIVGSVATASVIRAARALDPDPPRTLAGAASRLAARTHSVVLPSEPPAQRIDELPVLAEPVAKPAKKQPMIASAGSPEAPPVAARASMAAEIALIDRARRALTRGSPDEAITLLDQYNREFAGGTLANEARVLRIEALAKRGDRAQAKRLAGEFMESNPDDVHRERVEKLERNLSKP